MTDAPDWLPPLVLLHASGGDWSRYVEALYGFYRQDFVDSKPTFRGQDVNRKVTPVEQGKEASFWHLISEGRVEEERTPDLRRCERIRWPRPSIEHADEPVIKVWENRRGRDTRVCIWFQEVEYLVVLAVRRGYFLLWTAYPVTWAHTRRKLQREYEAYRRANAAPA
jgi:hypothetical protein